MTVFTERMCFPFHFCDIGGFELFRLKTKGFTRLLQALLNSHSDGNSHTHHGIVACAQEVQYLHKRAESAGLIRVFLAPILIPTGIELPVEGILCHQNP